MNNVVVGIMSATVASAITFVITRMHYVKQLDILASSTTEEVRSMHDQLSEVHRVFVAEQPIEVAHVRQQTWDTIAEATKSKVGKTDEEVVEEFRSCIEKAKQAQNEYKDLTERYSSDVGRVEIVDVEPTTDTVTDDPDIFLITELEFNDMDSRHSKEELHLWMVEEGLYDETDQALDACKGIIGMTLEQLMDFVDAHDNYDALYFRNEKTKGDYSVIIHRAGYSNFFQSVSNT